MADQTIQTATIAADGPSGGKAITRLDAFAARMAIETHYRRDCDRRDFGICGHGAKEICAGYGPGAEAAYGLIMTPEATARLRARIREALA